MKNFPNQASDFSRLRNTLATVEDLVDHGENVLDDGTLGYELARRRLYTFRGLDYSSSAVRELVEVRLVDEQSKPRSTQGSRTNAREMRRTLQALGWLADGIITTEGAELLGTEPGSLQERALLAQALWDLELSDELGTIHPVRTMLNLLRLKPSRHRDGLELALEPRNETSTEANRVEQLYLLPRSERQAFLDATDSQIANAVKIFPALAKAAGLVAEDAVGTLSLSPDGVALLQSGGARARDVIEQASKTRAREATHRTVRADAIATLGAPTIARPLSAEEQYRASELLNERTVRHQLLVRKLAAYIGAPGRYHEDLQSFDLLFEPDSPSLPLVLFEAKTVEDDAALQSRRAVGQLAYYHFFNVSPVWPGRSVVRVLVTDRPLAVDILSFLQAEGVATLEILEHGAWQFTNSVEPGLPHLLGFPGAALV